MFHAALIACPLPAADGCAPYTRPHHLVANIDLIAVLDRVAASEADENLCEELRDPT